MLLALGSLQGPLIDAPDGDGLTVLMHAAATGDAGAVTGLLDKGADANAQHASQGITALMCAAYFGHVEVVKTLLAKGGARPDLKDAAGASAADWATTGSRGTAADVLVKAGSQLNPFLNVGVLPFGLMDKAAGKAR